MKTKPGKEEWLKKYEGTYLAMVGEEVLGHQVSIHPSIHPQVFYSSSSKLYLTPTKNSSGSEWWFLQDTPGPGESVPRCLVALLSRARCPAVANAACGASDFTLSCDAHH